MCSRLCRGPSCSGRLDAPSTQGEPHISELDAPSPTDLPAPERRTRRRRSVPHAAVLALALLAPILAVYGPITLGGRSPVPYDALVADPAFRTKLAASGVDRPQNDLVADLVFQNVAWKGYLVETLRAGEVPLWNPYIFGGVPFFAAGQASPLYPTTALFLGLPIDSAFGWAAVLNLWVAALAMAALGRRLGVGWFAAGFMGLTWSLSLLFVANTVFPMIQAAMAWTPALLAGIEGAARAAEAGYAGRLLPRGRATLWLGVAAVATAMIGVAGHAEYLYYAGLTAAAYALARTAGVARMRGARAATTFVTWIGVAGLTGLLLAGAQLVPLAELARTNWRSGSAPYAEIVSYAFGLRQAVTFVLPDFYGNPAHHSTWDLAQREAVALGGHTMWGTAIGAKNYVEAAAYVGVATLLFAVIGLLAGRSRARLFFGGFAAVALTFVFGLPSYLLPFHLLPGFDQLHTPFRWVFPVGLCLVVLAGLGADRLASGPPPVGARRVATFAVAATAVLFGVLAAGWAQPATWIGAVSAVLARLPGATEAVVERFGNLSAFGGYTFMQAVHLAAFGLLAGLAALTLSGPRGSRRLGKILAVTAVAGDLVLVGAGVHPAVDPALSRAVPEVVDWLSDAQSNVAWGRLIGVGDDRVLWPNTPMRFGIADIRGYDSIIPHWTVTALRRVDDQSESWLRHNRVGNLAPGSRLDHPVLAILGARYVASTSPLNTPGLRRAFEGDGVLIYENQAAQPRVWIATDVQVSDAPLEAAEAVDLTTTVVVEQAPDERWWQLDLPPGRPALGLTRVTAEGANHLVIDVSAPTGAMLVIGDAWFPGWRAFVSVGSGPDRAEVEVPVLRAYGLVRSVPVPAGRSEVTLRYFPMSVKIGVYASFIGALLLLLGAAYAVWERLIMPRRRDSAGRIAVNSVGPMGAALVNKVVDFAFAMLMLRLLGPENAGKYYTAITVIGFAEIFTNFGLNLYTTREVARRPGEAPAFLVQTAALRLALWLAALPGLGLFALFRQLTGAPLAQDTLFAIALLAFALVPSNINAALTSIFHAFEDMVYPAGVSIVSTVLKVSLGALALLLGYGFVGLAAVAIGVNWATLVCLGAGLASLGVRPAWSLQAKSLRFMAGSSLPFMLNHLLQTVFFKIDVLLLDQLKGPLVVGWYSAAYKWVDALLIIPGTFVMALFPALSRHGTSDREALRSMYIVALRWLVSLALPLAMATTFLAEALVGLLAGPSYLPAGAIALQVMIWFLPLSFINGLTQYVLLAIDRQHWITPSFAVAVTFNVLANLWAIPEYGYVGAAVVTIISEVVLLVPFMFGLRDLGAPPLLALVWRPALATSLMGGVLAAADGAGIQPALGAAAGAAIYLICLVRLGGVTDGDRAILRRVARPRSETSN
jgi:O-antigen/teichoic acid export membrane protein